MAEGTLSTTDECGEALAEKLALENPVAIVKAVANLKPEVVIAALKKNKVSREEIGVLSDAYYDLADACHDLYMGMDKPV